MALRPRIASAWISLRKLRNTLEKKCARESCKKKEATEQDAKALGKGFELMRALQGKAGK